MTAIEFLCSKLNGQEVTIYRTLLDDCWVYRTEIIGNPSKWELIKATLQLEEKVVEGGIRWRRCFYFKDEIVEELDFNFDSILPS